MSAIGIPQLLVKLFLLGLGVELIPAALLLLEGAILE
jgi:hypothetical protein